MGLVPQIDIINRIEKYLDQTLLKPEATPLQIEKFCKEAVYYKFHSICVNPIYVKMAKKILRSSGVRVTTVVGFPLGASKDSIKLKEAELALKEGADELDMVMNIGMFKGQNYDYVRDEIRKIKELCGRNVLKVILETSLLSVGELVTACEIAVEANADFVKTSTGFIGHGAKIDDVTLMKNTVKSRAKVKASGGIRTLTDAINMIEAGADRIGTSSGVNIVEEAIKLRSRNLSQSS